MNSSLHSCSHGQITPLILTLILLVFPLISSAQDAANLIKNGNFAKGKAPWKGVGKQTPGMIEVPLNSGRRQEFSQAFNNKALTTKFTITFKYKTSDDFETASDEKLDLTERKLMAQIAVLNTAAGSHVDVSKTSEWKTISVAAGISPAQKKSELVIFVPRGKGTIYFTDFTLQPSD